MNEKLNYDEGLGSTERSAIQRTLKDKEDPFEAVRKRLKGVECVDDPDSTKPLPQVKSLPKTEFHGMPQSGCVTLNGRVFRSNEKTD